MGIRQRPLLRLLLRRTISSTDADVRPIPVLRATMDYLLKILNSSQHPFEVVHDFVFDKTRSIRQDLSMQNIVNEQTTQIYEDVVKFHILSHQKLAKICHNSDMSSLCYLNMEQLMKFLLSLFEMYDAVHKSSSLSNNAAEFYSFYVLLHLGHKIPKMGDSPSLWYRQLAAPVLQSKEMQFARTVLRYSHLGNFKSFFQTIADQATDLQLCLVEPFLNEVRAHALMYFNLGGYKAQPYPLTHLSEILMIKESELEPLCMTCGLEITKGEAGSKFLPAKQASFCLPKPGFPSCSISISGGI